MAHTPVLDSFRLDGKVALVTGGARGLGLTMATALAEAGADVALTAARVVPARRLPGRFPRPPAGARRRSRPTSAGVRHRPLARLSRPSRSDRHPRQQCRHQHPRRGRSAVRDGLGQRNRHQLKGRSSCPERSARTWSSADGGAWTSGFDSRHNRARRPRALRGIEGRGDRPDARAGARMGGDRVTANAICPGPFATEMNLPLLERSREGSGVRPEDSDGPLGRAGPDRGRRGVPGVASIIVRHRHVALRRWGLDSAISNAEC